MYTVHMCMNSTCFHCAPVLARTAFNHARRRSSIISTNWPLLQSGAQIWSLRIISRMCWHCRTSCTRVTVAWGTLYDRRHKRGHGLWHGTLHSDWTCSSENGTGTSFLVKAEACLLQRQLSLPGPPSLLLQHLEKNVDFIVALLKKISQTLELGIWGNSASFVCDLLSGRDSLLLVFIWLRLSVVKVN